MLVFGQRDIDWFNELLTHDTSSTMLNTMSTRVVGIEVVEAVSRDLPVLDCG